MIAELRTACWSSDQAAARKLETPTARRWHGHRSLRSSKRGGWGSFTYYGCMLPRVPTLRLALRTDWRTFARPVGEWNSPTRVSLQVSGGGSGRSCRPCRFMSASTIWRLLRPFRYLIGSREPAQGRARPMASSRTCASRPVRRGRSRSRAKRVSTRFSEGLAIADPRVGKGVKERWTPLSVSQSG